MSMMTSVAVDRLQKMTPAKLYDLLVELAPRLSDEQLKVVRGIADAESRKRGI